LQARLEYTPIEELLGFLDTSMTGVQDVCEAVTETVTTSFFAAADSRAWTTEGTR